MVRCKACGNVATVLDGSCAIQLSAELYTVLLPCHNQGKGLVTCHPQTSKRLCPKGTYVIRNQGKGFDPKVPSCHPQPRKGLCPKGTCHSQPDKGLCPKGTCHSQPDKGLCTKGTCHSQSVRGLCHTIQWHGPRADIPCYNTQHSGVVPKRVFHATTQYNGVVPKRVFHATTQYNGVVPKRVFHATRQYNGVVPRRVFHATTKCSGVVPRRMFHATSYNGVVPRRVFHATRHNTMAWSQGGCSMPQHTIQWRGPKAAAPCHSSGNGFILSGCRFPRLFSSTTSLVVLSGAVRISRLLYTRCNVLFMHGNNPPPPRRTLHRRLGSVVFIIKLKSFFFLIAQNCVRLDYTLSAPTHTQAPSHTSIIITPCTHFTNNFNRQWTGTCGRGRSQREAENLAVLLRWGKKCLEVRFE